jgi:hypothetical protein
LLQVDLLVGFVGMGHQVVLFFMGSGGVKVAGWLQAHFLARSLSMGQLVVVGVMAWHALGNSSVHVGGCRMGAGQLAVLFFTAWPWGVAVSRWVGAGWGSGSSQADGWLRDGGMRQLVVLC